VSTFGRCHLSLCCRQGAERRTALRGTLNRPQTAQNRPCGTEQRGMNGCEDRPHGWLADRSAWRRCAVLARHAAGNAGGMVPRRRACGLPPPPDAAPCLRPAQHVCHCEPAAPIIVLHPSCFSTRVPSSAFHTRSSPEGDVRGKWTADLGATPFFVGHC
jgi:hypothetical protein